MSDDSIDVKAEGKKRIASQQQGMRETAQDEVTSNRLVKQNKGNKTGIAKDISSREMYGIMTTDPSTPERSRVARESTYLHKNLDTTPETHRASRQASVAKEYKGVKGS